MGRDEVVRDYLRIARDLDLLLPGAADLPGSEPDRSGVRRPVPADLVRRAGMLAASLSTRLPVEPAEFLRGQLVAVDWTARRLAGQPVRYIDEVRAAFDTRIGLGSIDAYRAAHRDLDAVLPGTGALRERIADHRGRDEIPRDRVGAAVRVMSAALRERVSRTIPLPEGESVEFVVVDDDAPWVALHHYRGRYRSRITVNAGARPRRGTLAALVAHEAYPGHHVERCRKEVGLVASGWGEHRITLTCSPQSLIAEGAAELGLRAVVGTGWGGGRTRRPTSRARHSSVAGGRWSRRTSVSGGSWTSRSRLGRCALG